MSKIRVKICGITNQQDAELAVRLGADAIGLNLFSGSKRYVRPDMAQEFANSLPPFVAPIALFVNEPISRILTIAEPISRTIQWHGDDTPLPPPAPWRFIPAFNIADHAGLAKVSDYLDRCRKVGRLPTAVLIDGHAPGQFGGTGQNAPWNLIADFKPGIPIILAGGLTPENVAEAIRIVHPYAVDVAGGVESSPGRKDPEKVRRFLDAAHSAL